jgi:hypothetical protein
MTFEANQTNLDFLEEFQPISDKESESQKQKRLELNPRLLKQMGLSLDQYLFDFVGGMLYSFRNEVKRRILLEELAVEQPAPKTIQEIIDDEKQLKWM